MEHIINKYLPAIISGCSDFSVFISGLQQQVLAHYPWDGMNPWTICKTDFKQKIIYCDDNTGLRSYGIEEILQTATFIRDRQRFPLKDCIKEIVQKGFVTSVTSYQENGNYVEFEKELANLCWFIFQRAFVFAAEHFNLMNSLTVTARSSFSLDERTAAIATADALFLNVYEVMRFKMIEKCPSISPAGISALLNGALPMLSDEIAEYISIALVTSSADMNLKGHLARAAELLLIDVVESLEDWFGGDLDQLGDVPKALAIFILIASEIKCSIALGEWK